MINMKNRFGILAIVICIALILCLTSGCGSDSVNNGGAELPSNEIILNDTTNRKIVYSIDVCYETKDVDTFVNLINTNVETFNGWTDNSYSSNYNGSSFSCTVRIPTEKINEFLASFEGQGELTSKSVSSKDITTSYVSASAKKQSLLEQKATLNSILERTDLSVADILSITTRIADINTELYEIDIELANFDSLVDYSQIHISVYLPENYTGQIVFTVIFGLIIIGVIAYFVCNKIRKNKKVKDTQ